METSTIGTKGAERKSTLEDSIYISSRLKRKEETGEEIRQQDRLPRGKSELQEDS